MKHTTNLLFIAYFWIGVMISITTYGQGLAKPAIDSAVYKNWPSVTDPGITSNGKYAFFTIENEPVGGKTLVVKAISGTWIKKFVNYDGQPQFSINGKTLVVQTRNELSLIKLGTDFVETFQKVKSYRLSPNKINQYLTMQMAGDTSDLLTIIWFDGQKNTTLRDVKNYVFSPTGDILYQSLDLTKASEVKLKLYHFNQNTTDVVWSGVKPQNFIFDKSGNQIAFLSGARDSTALWLYKVGKENSVRRIDYLSPKMDKMLDFDRIERFSSDGSILFYNLKERLVKGNRDAINLNVWNYKDPILQSQQVANTYAERYTHAYVIKTSKNVRLAYPNERVNMANGSNRTDNYKVLSTNKGRPGEAHWNPNGEEHTFIISTLAGDRKAVPNGGFISPEEKFYIYFDRERLDYFSYEISSGITRNITAPTKTSFVIDNSKNKKTPFGWGGIFGWLKNDKAIFLSDGRDLWQIDPTNNSSPVEITGGFGKSSDIFFERLTEYPDPVVTGDKIVLVGFNRKTKENGFFQVEAGKSNKPIELYSGNYCAYAPLGLHSVFDGLHFKPLKALNSKEYIIRKMDASHAPNFYVTANFKDFTPLSNIAPEKKYNWYTTELHQYDGERNKNLQGVLYKPENFDPEKKYPVILYYYDELSDNLNCYIKPVPSNGTINIPWYVSNGYLVFTPDIFYEVGDPFEDTKDCVESAAKYLTSLPYVNEKRMGINGLSWGGVQTQYLVTHSNMFAAACAGASHSDFVSGYNGLMHNLMSGQEFYERGQIRVNFTVWDKPEWWIKNSPIMNANKVTTPLLMLGDPNDEACPIAQAIEMFNALRRLKKPVWLLEYADGNHGVWGKSAMDFDLRLQQFFNYYLKDALPPKWMTEGRPAKLKGIDERLELDLSGLKP